MNLNDHSPTKHPRGNSRPDGVEQIYRITDAIALAFGGDHSLQLHYQNKENSMRLYVGNLAREVNEQDLTDTFQPFGELAEITVMRDKINNISKGFAFVEMRSDDEARKAIEKLGGKELKGRVLNVNEARPRTERPSRGNWGGGSQRF
jgi:RNA recognition motif-containing protein